uniref:hypothetical protein n=1 Tax=Acinetobacter radioresistens TaxID=40216 RepID=UPI0005B4C9F5|nr:hypothetical protein [Acinetobacter radioresistens]
MDENNQVIYTGYSGNRISKKLTVFFNGKKYKFLFQTFDRTQPTREERSRGIKAKRILLSEKELFFSSLENINFKLFPFQDFREDLIIKLNLVV